MATGLTEALRARGIKTMPVAPIEDGFACISMTTYSVQEFLTALAPGPIDGSDELASRISGRPQDLAAGDVPWRFEVSVYPPGFDSGLELFVIVSIPDADVPEVVRRLGG